MKRTAYLVEDNRTAKYFVHCAVSLFDFIFSTKRVSHIFRIDIGFKYVHNHNHIVE